MKQEISMKVLLNEKIAFVVIIFNYSEEKNVSWIHVRHKNMLSKIWKRSKFNFPSNKILRIKINIGKNYQFIHPRPLKSNQSSINIKSIPGHYFSYAFPLQYSPNFVILSMFNLIVITSLTWKITFYRR